MNTALRKHETPIDVVQHYTTIQPVDRLATRVDEPLLHLEALNVAFDGFKVIDNLSFQMADNQLRCLIGPNGAGKTTLMDIVTGKTRPDSGIARFRGKTNLLMMSEHDIAQAGIGRKFQTPTVLENLSVFENLEISLGGPRGVWATLRARLDSTQRDRIEDLAVATGLQDALGKTAGSLSHGQKQWLALAMLTIQNPALMLVDEPAAGMTTVEMEKTVELLRTLAMDHAVIVVEHDMEFVRALHAPVTVLHQGAVLAEGSMDQIQSDSRVMEVYLGQ